MTNYGIHINAAGRHEVYQTEDEIRRIPIRDFAKPREAIAFAAMRDLRVSPLRSAPDEAPTSGALQSDSPRARKQRREP